MITHHYHSLTRFIQHCSQDLSYALDQPPPPPSLSPFILSFSPRVADEKNVIKGARSRGPLTLAHTLAHACTHRCVYVYNESGWQPAAWPLRVNDARRPRRCRNVCAVAVVTCTRTQQPRLLSAS